MPAEPRSPRLAVVIDAYNASAKIVDGLFEEMPQEAERVLSLISSVVVATPSENWEIKPSNDGDWDLLASGERVEISLTENTKNVPHVPTPAEIRLLAFGSSPS